MRGNWLARFREGGRLYLTDELYAKARAGVEEDLPVYFKYIREGSRILEAACGPGYTAIPLSHHFKVTAFDRDERVLAAAKENARKFGGDIEFVKADFFDIADVFGVDSFDAVSSGGVLEHFPKDKVETLVNLQLKIAPILFAQMPLYTEDDVKGMSHGIEAFPYTKDDWLDILGNHRIFEHRILHKRPAFGKFREFMVVVGRK